MKHVFVLAICGIVTFWSNFAYSQTTIDTSPLPSVLDSDAVITEVQIPVQTSESGDLVVDLLSNVDWTWYGGDRQRVEPGNSLVTISVPIFNEIPKGSNYQWNTFFAPPGADYRDAIVFGDPRPVTVEEDFVITKNEIQITDFRADTNNPGSVVVDIDYAITTNGYVNINLFNSENNWVGGKSVALSAGSGLTSFSFKFARGDTGGEYTFHSYLSAQAGDWTSALRWGALVSGEIAEIPKPTLSVSAVTPVVTVGGSVELSYQYTLDRSRDIVIDIFDADSGQWKAQQRIANLSGAGNSSVVVDVSALAAGNYRTNSFVTSNGDNWTGALAWSDTATFTISVAPEGKILTDTTLEFPLSWVDRFGAAVEEQRQALVRVPEGANEKTPIVILFHGSFDTASNILNKFLFLDSNILVSCQGYLNDWNISYDAHQGPDVEFVRQLITELKSYDNVDADQISLLGFSNGAGLVNRMIIEGEAGLFRNAISLSQQLRYIQHQDGSFKYDPNGRWDYTDDIAPATDKRILSIHGGNDEVLSYEGFFSDDVALWYTNIESINLLAQGMGYTGTPLSIEDGVSDSDVIKYSFLDEQVIHYKLLNGNHSLEVPGNGMAKTRELILDFLSE